MLIKLQCKLLPAIVKSYKLLIRSLNLGSACRAFSDHVNMSFISEEHFQDMYMRPK